MLYQYCEERNIPFSRLGKLIVAVSAGDEEKLQQAIIQAMDLKPESHHFSLDDEPQIVRFMNTTGG